MNNPKLKKEKTVALPSILLWAAGKKSHSTGNQQDLALVLELFKKSVTFRKKEEWSAAGAETSFLSIAKKNLGKGVIPFERDELDLNLASTLYKRVDGFIVRSNNSYVEPGFLRVRNDDIQYVNFSKEMNRYESKNIDFFDDSKKSLLLNFLDDLSSKTITYETSNDGKRIIKINGEFSSFSKLDKKFDCSISLWNGPTKSQDGSGIRKGALNRRLGLAEIETSKGGELFLSNLSAQSQLEITAASLVNQWLLIDSEQLKFFGQLPDLTEEGDSRRVAVDPTGAFAKFLLQQTPMVYIEKSSASYFSKKYSWFVPNDSQIWLEAITQ
jgi:hypothetical protein